MAGIRQLFLVYTEINGVKHYVRRIRVSKYVSCATMVTVNAYEAYDFGSLHKATKFKDSCGIGKAIGVLSLSFPDNFPKQED